MRRLLLLPLLLTAACGDVGDAPAATTAAADTAATPEPTGTALAIDTTRSTVAWRGAKVTGAHDGGFRSFQGTVMLDDTTVTGVDVTMDATTLFSDNDRLTNHLKSEDFFDVAAHPEARFVATTFAPVDSAGATHLVTGNLTMHGQTRAVTFPATITVADGAVRATADFIIDRTQWGIVYTGRADDLIAEEVRIRLDVVAGPEGGTGRAPAPAAADTTAGA